MVTGSVICDKLESLNIFTTCHHGLVESLESYESGLEEKGVLDCPV